MSKYKTELCHKFKENGVCPYKGRCRFAHGPDELRPKPNLTPNHKTVKCSNYHGPKNCCRYGSRCRFIHGERDPPVTDWKFESTEFPPLPEPVVIPEPVIPEPEPEPTPEPSPRVSPDAMTTEQVTTRTIRVEIVFRGLTREIEMPIAVQCAESVLR